MKVCYIRLEREKDGKIVCFLERKRKTHTLFVSIKSSLFHRSIGEYIAPNTPNYHILSLLVLACPAIPKLMQFRNKYKYNKYKFFKALLLLKMSYEL